MIPSLPPELAQSLATHRWERIAVGQSKAAVYRLHSPQGADLILKILKRDRFLSLQGEVERLKWLQGRLPVPEVVGFHPEAEHDFLLMRALPGDDASNKRLSSAAMVDLLTEALRFFHTVPISDCPFRFSVADGVADAKAILDAGRVAIDSFDPENIGRDPHEMFEELLALQPRETADVFTHGDFCLPNVIVNHGTLAGFIDFGRAGVGDVHRDLAIGSRSIERNLGPDAVDRFFQLYGTSHLDPARLRFFRLLDEFV